MAKYYSILCVCISQLLYPFSINGPLGCLHTLAVVKDAAVNTEVQTPSRAGVFASSGYVPGSEIIE